MMTFIYVEIQKFKIPSFIFHFNLLWFHSLTVVDITILGRIVLTLSAALVKYKEWGCQLLLI